MAYCTLQQARTQMTVGNDTTDDAILAALLEPATRLIETYCGQPFIETYAEYWFNGEVGSQNPTLNLQNRPLISATTVVNGDGSVIDPSKYDLLPKGTIYPKQAVRLTLGNTWAAPFSNSNNQPCIPLAYYGPLVNRNYAVDALEIKGLWGFNRKGTSAWLNTGLTLSANITDSDTTLTISGSPAGKFDVGSPIKIGDEQMTISGDIALSVSSGFTDTSPTVVRGENGTTAAAHTAGDAIYVYQVEAAITVACAMLAAWLYQTRLDNTGNSFTVSEFGSVTIPVDFPPRVKKMLSYPYYNWYWGRGS